MTKATASRNTENLRGVEAVVSVDRLSSSEGAEGSEISTVTLRLIGSAAEDTPPSAPRNSKLRQLWVHERRLPKVIISDQQRRTLAFNRFSFAGGGPITHDLLPADEALRVRRVANFAVGEKMTPARDTQRYAGVLGVCCCRLQKGRAGRLGSTRCLRVTATPPGQRLFPACQCTADVRSMTFCGAFGKRLRRN
jgi:hypothetical protein